MKTTVIFFISLFLAQTVLGQDEFTLAKSGSTVPEFSFELTPGTVKKITDFRGKVVLITFFATWCGPCRQELPHIDKEIFGKYSSNPDFALLLFGREHDWATVDKFRTEQGFAMPLFPDPGRTVFAQFAGQNIPRNFLIDKNGKIVYSSVGFNVKEFWKMKIAIEKALKNKK